MYDYDKYEMTDLCEGALKRYFEHGLPPGSFLTAIICNDLHRAVGCADSFNLPLIPEYVKFMVNEVPGNAWGNAETMRSWMNQQRNQHKES